MSPRSRLIQLWRRRPTVHPVLAMVLVALLLRMCVVLLVLRDVASPAEDHQQFGWEMGWVARSIASSHGFAAPFAPLTGPTALVPPMYPYLLAGIFRLLGIYSVGSALAILAMNSVLSSLTCIPVFFVSRQMNGQKTALVAGWLWCLYPFSIYYSSTRVWDYSLTSLLLALCWWIAQNLHRRPTALKSAGFGLFYGFAALSNPCVLALYPILLGSLAWKTRQLGRRSLLHGGLIVMGTLLAVTPWTMRNWRVLHAVIPMRDGLWLEAWAGNHGDSSTPNPSTSHPASNPAEMIRYQGLGEIAYIAEKRAMTLDYVALHPVQTMVVSARRMVRFWTGFWSFRLAYMQDQPLDLPNLFFCSGVTFLMLRGARRYWLVSRSAALPFILMMIVFPIPYYLTHSSMDYRQPIEPEIIMLVAAAVTLRGSRVKQEEESNYPVTASL